MDAVKFVDAYIRMCSQGLDCEDCPLYQSDEIDFCTAVPQKRSREGAEKVVQIVEQWAKEHPVKTRQSEFLKLFPDADIFNRKCECMPKQLIQRKTRLLAIPKLSFL